MTSLRILLYALLASVSLGSPLLAQDSKVVNKTYRIGSDFLHPGGGGAASADPFSGEDPGQTDPVKNVQQVLTAELGIEFPEGTWVRYDPRTGRLEIQHQPGVVAAIEAYFAALNPGQKSISVRAEIYQVPALAALQLQQFCGALDDHSAARKSVMAMVEKKQASLVTTAPILARSGQRSKATQVDEVIYPTEIDWDEDQGAFIPVAFETRDVGTDFEVDVVLGADDFTIDMNLSLQHHTAPPTMRPVSVTSAKTGKKTVAEFPEFHAKRVITQIVLHDGAVKLLGAWRPTGKPEFENADVMQIVFVQAHVVTTPSFVPQEAGESK